MRLCDLGVRDGRRGRVVGAAAQIAKVALVEQRVEGQPRTGVRSECLRRHRRARHVARHDLGDPGAIHDRGHIHPIHEAIDIDPVEQFGHGYLGRSQEPRRGAGASRDAIGPQPSVAGS